MKHPFYRKTVQFVMLAALLLALIPSAGAASAGTLDDTTTIRVGLAYGDNTLPTANLENALGSGYRLGYYDSGLNFVPLGYTDQVKISVLKTHNIYLTGGGDYTTSAGSSGVVGCYHVQLPGCYADFESARAAADAVGGFVAWISGTYFVRVGSYTSASQAAAAAEGYSGASMGETTKYGISVTATGTANILFQFDDGGSGTGLGILPDVSGAADPQTWFKGYKYRGGFRYQRIDGGSLTVVNVLSLGDYVKGVVPYEMSPSWPLEALKVQAVCARTYALFNMNKHRSYGFDLCNTIECQVYYGTNRENDNTFAAVMGTAGETVKYNGKCIDAVFSASNGGASESSANVWNNDFPYLQGIIDPYEALVASEIPNYNWTKSFTGAELQQRLVAKGFTRCGVITSVTITKTEMGNVYSMTFHDANGKDWTVYREKCRTYFGFSSQRFDLSDGTAGPGETGSGNVSVNGTQAGPVSGMYVVDGNGNRTQVGSDVYIITDTGTQPLTGNGGSSAGGGTTTGSGSNGTFVFRGSGNGHNVGMSQWGANAMARQGFGYREILTFYYTGVTIE